MQVETRNTNSQGDSCPESPVKRRPGDRFSHFSRLKETKLNDSDVFSMRLSSTADLAAVSFFDGSLQVVSTCFIEQVAVVKDDEMVYPITSLAWKPAS